MSGATIIFYVLAAFTLVCGILSVTTRQIFRAAIYLLFCLIGVAGIYFWLDYQFIAAVQIIVYAGGIVVLIIFSIFLTQQAGAKLPIQKLSRKLFAFFAVCCGFALVMLQVYTHEFYLASDTTLAPTMAQIGEKMLNVTPQGYALPFEVISILLLAALVGCIVIAISGKTNEEPGIKNNKLM